MILEANDQRAVEKRESRMIVVSGAKFTARHPLVTGNLVWDSDGQGDNEMIKECQMEMRTLVALKKLLGTLS